MLNSRNQTSKMSQDKASKSASDSDFMYRSLYDKIIVKNTPIAYRLCSELIKIYYSVGILLFIPTLHASELGYLQPLYTPHFNDIMLGLFIGLVAGGLIFIPILLLPTTFLVFICYKFFWQWSSWRYIFALIFQAWHFIIWSYIVSYFVFFLAFAVL